MNASSSGIDPRLMARFNQLARARPLESGAILPLDGGPLAARIGQAQRSGFGFFVMDLFEPGADPLRDDFAVSDRALSARQWQPVVGRGLWSDAAPVEAWMRQVAWARHLGLKAVWFSMPALPVVWDLAAAVLKELHPEQGPKVWLGAGWDDVEGGWKTWRTLRRLTHEHAGLQLCLSARATVPSAETQDRWWAEPIGALEISEDVFHEGGISAEADEMLERAFRTQAKHVVLKSERIESVRAVFERVWGPETDFWRYDVDFHDRLVEPVQPLRDHISATVYENFELARPKYDAYERALRTFLASWSHSRPAVIIVVGAGRGGLVQAALQAADATQTVPAVYAVEKNPNAVVTLRHRNRDEWGDRVTIVDGDMRQYDAPQMADVLVSELLGGFADNELSPECLDGAQRFLQPGGIMIPRSSTSYLAPVTSGVLFGALPQTPGATDTTYGARTTGARLLAEPQACFHFEHPAPTVRDDNQHNARHAVLTFEARDEGTLHGFLGFFDAPLDADIVLTSRDVPGVSVAQNWAALFLPLRQPVSVMARQTIVVHVWRRTDGRRSWYEWALAAPEVGPVQNADGVQDDMAL